jgi:hypothetical protein
MPQYQSLKPLPLCDNAKSAIATKKAVIKSAGVLHFGSELRPAQHIAANIAKLPELLRKGLTSCGRPRCGGSHAHPNRLPQLRAYRRCRRRVASARTDLLTTQAGSMK